MERAGKSPKQLLRRILDETFAVSHGSGCLSGKQLRALKRKLRSPVDGNDLWNVGFWNLLYNCLSSEAYAFLRDALGYLSIVGNWNAAEAIPWLQADFHEGAQYLTLSEGMDSLVSRMAEEFVVPPARR